MFFDEACRILWRSLFSLATLVPFGGQRVGNPAAQAVMRLLQHRHFKKQGKALSCFFSWTLFENVGWGVPERRGSVGGPQMCSP